MGLSSNARLLSITARLTSNEYESQQVSNAKMRLATQSQQASEEYIRALNTTDYAFVSYDSEGNCVNVPLTAAVLYQYAGSKNQYMLSNAAGQALVSPEDAKNYENSANLQEFLEKYGLKANYRTKALEEYAKNLNDKDLLWHYDAFYTNMQTKINFNATNNKATSTALEKLKKGELALTSQLMQSPVKDKEGNAITDENGKTVYAYDYNYINQNVYSVETWQYAYSTYKEKYEDSIEEYNKMLDDRAAGATNSDTINDTINDYAEKLAEAKADYANTVSYETWVEYCFTKELEWYKEGDEYLPYDNYHGGDYEGLLNGYLDYKENLNNYKIELEELGIDASEAYTYDDSAKAQWYTNLWYRMNGESAIKNENSNYQALDMNLLTSTSWVRDALAHGTITIEVANATSVQKSIENENMPTIINAKGVNWTPKIFTNCSDITQRDDDKAIEKAEAVYKKAMAEITAKDEKYQRKLSLLDTEHNAIQNEYESVKSALGKNIERSFKTFQG